MEDMSAERRRLNQMVLRMIEFYDNAGVEYACKERAGMSLDSFDPRAMHLQDRSFMDK